MRVWVDIENPPQVQYLMPFARRFGKSGDEVALSAQDYGMTHALLRQAGATFEPIGRRPGAGKARKVIALVGRAAALRRWQRRRRPDALLCAGRSAVLAGRSLGVATFALGDYEHANLTPYRLAKAHMILPDAVDPDHLVERGFDRDRIVTYPGLKEDFTFADVDLKAVRPHEFAVDAALMRVLIRPAAEQSHYHRAATAELVQRLLAYLAGRDDVVVVFSARYDWQERYLAGHRWVNPPILLREPVPVVSLLKGVDAVISSGGTMYREAAYLGVPAYSVFQGRTGGVDRRLEELGRGVRILSQEQFDELRYRKVDGLSPLRTGDEILRTVIAVIRQRAAGRDR